MELEAGEVGLSDTQTVAFKGRKGPFGRLSGGLGVHPSRALRVIRNNAMTGPAVADIFRTIVGERALCSAWRAKFEGPILRPFCAEFAGAGVKKA